METSENLLREYRSTINQLKLLLQEEEKCVEKNYKLQVEEKEKLQIEINEKIQLLEKPFVILFLGSFGSGKSSLINALLGEDLLPTGFLPETAIPVELHYSEEKQMVIYPKKNMSEYGNKPFSIRKVDSEEVERFTSLTSDNSVVQQQKFEKVAIYYPFEILKNGFVFIDTPGWLNGIFEPDKYLACSDLIVYSMNSLIAYTLDDKENLSYLNSLGVYNIIAVYSLYDVLTKEYKKRPERLEKIRHTFRQHMKKHSELGPDAIHFIDSLGGLTAKLSNDDFELKRSGIKGLEDYIARYLIENIGKKKIEEVSEFLLEQREMLLSAITENVLESE